MQGFGRRTESVELDNNSSAYVLLEIYGDFKSELTPARNAKNPIYTVLYMYRKLQRVYRVK